MSVDHAMQKLRDYHIDVGSQRGKPPKALCGAAFKHVSRSAKQPPSGINWQLCHKCEHRLEGLELGIDPARILLDALRLAAGEPVGGPEPPLAQTEHPNPGGYRFIYEAAARGHYRPRRRDLLAYAQRIRRASRAKEGQR